jgi:hypothetical protein
MYARLNGVSPFSSTLVRITFVKAPIFSSVIRALARFRDLPVEGDLGNITTGLKLCDAFPNGLKQIGSFRLRFGGMLAHAPC